MKISVAHLTGDYLPLTETWLYNNQITNLKHYKPIIIAQKTMNLDKFPTKNVYSFEDHNLFYRKANQLSLKFTGKYLSQKKETINRHNVKVLHSHFGYEGFKYLRLKKSVNLPMVTTFYGFDVSMPLRSPSWRKKYTELFHEGELFLTEGSYMKEELIKLGCHEDKILVQHLGVDLKKFNYTSRELPEDGNIRILIAGSFREKKGIPYAIQSFAEVKKNYPNIQLRILGDGPLRGQIESLIKKLNISKSVDLLGYQDHEIFLKEAVDAHMFLLPSITAGNGDTEGGAPVAIIEAQATGLPIISSYHADIPEVVVEGKSALLAPEKDIDCLANHLEYLIKTPELWAKMGFEGRKHIEKEYDLIKQVEKLEKIYDTLI